MDKRLLDYSNGSIDLNAKDDDEETALKKALYWGHVEVAELVKPDSTIKIRSSF